MTRREAERELKDMGYQLAITLNTPLAIRYLELHGKLSDWSRARSKPLPKADAVYLSPRERQVVQLVWAGKSDKEAATALGISTNAIKQHLGRIRLKSLPEYRAGGTQ